MPIISIIEQPSANALKAAYRPIVFVVRASRTDGNAKPPIVYCDIYIDDVFYKTQERTIYKTLNSTNSDWQFDIMDAVQEVLSSTIQQNGGSAIVKDSLAMRSVYCKFRSSGYDVNSFITSEGTAPVQGTGTVNPVAGTGTQSNSFFGVISTLQHEQNQDAATHLGYYKTGTWDANVFPLTHRKPGYKVCKGDSDYFPIVNLSSKDPLCLKLFYKKRGDAAYSSVQQCGSSTCAAVSIPTISFADAIVDTPYSKTVPLGGTAPFNLSSFSSTAAWLRADIVGSDLVFSGTPAAGDVGTNKAVNVIVTNACGSASAYKSISVVSGCTAVGISGTPLLPDAYSDQPYSAAVILTGTGPFNITVQPDVAWLVADISDNEVILTGTPGIGDVGTGITVAFTVTNGCGSVDYSDTIDVIQSGTRFGDTTFNGGDDWNESETANIIGGQPGATITITLDTLTNTNGGQLKVNGLQAFQGYTWNIVLDSNGNGSLDVDIAGLEHPSTSILGHFTVTSVTGGTIGTPNTYQISKAF